MPVLYPPHPNLKISRGYLDTYEKEDQWVAQRKFNGTHVVIHISKDREFSILTRHGTAPKLFKLSKHHIDQFKSLNLEEGKAYWLDGELLDHKTKNPFYKEKIILFDILFAGESLSFKLNQEQRLDLLSEICRHPNVQEPENKIALLVTNDIWMAESFQNDFTRHFDEFIHLDEIEGLVLRKKNSFIENEGTREYDVPWIVKCRKPHSGKTYRF